VSLSIYKAIIKKKGSFRIATTTGQEAYEARGRLQGQTTKTPTQIQAQLHKEPGVGTGERRNKQGGGTGDVTCTHSTNQPPPATLEALTKTTGASGKIGNDRKSADGDSFLVYI